MSYGKMNSFIDIITTEPVRDAEGFVSTGDTVLASVRANKEDRRGTAKWVKWASMAEYSMATTLFRFRCLPGIEINTSLYIACDAGRYRILNVENVRERGMYLEALAEKLEATGR
jgi:hypothetical protein